MNNFNEHIERSLETPKQTQDFKSSPESDSFLDSLFQDDYERAEKIEADPPAPSLNLDDINQTYHDLFSDDYKESPSASQEVVKPYPSPKFPDDLGEILVGDKTDIPIATPSDIPADDSILMDPMKSPTLDQNGPTIDSPFDMPPIIYAAETPDSQFDVEKFTASTKDKYIDQQNDSINRVESGETSLDTPQEKGNYGEMKTDQDLREKGYERISTDMVKDVNDPGHQGIDGVYYNPDGHPPYIIVDAKYGSAQLSETADGKQMSDNWIDKRLDDAVGKEKADEIRMEKLTNPDNVGSYVAHVDENGNVSYDKLDADGNVERKDVEING